jgi:N-acetyl-gamma-glutamylphosphate reductase
MEQELGLLSRTAVHVHFTPVYVPITRGILGICRGFLNKPISRHDLLELYREYYQSHPFVQLYDLPKEPSVSCIGLDVDEERNSIVVFSALDSVGKGGAQVGVENMNIMFGIDRTVGLTRRGLHPN